MILLLDAANTIIHKPSLYSKFNEAIKLHQAEVKESDFIKVHKILSELITFPDRTTKSFYFDFNKRLLEELKIQPSDKMLESVFDACSYLPWEKYEDTNVLSQLKVKKAVLSNFNNNLDSILDTHFPGVFDQINCSEVQGMRKPSIEFYENAIKNLGVKASDILYVGDSIKLDMEPALEVGMRAYLIDRESFFPTFKHRINSLYDLKDLL
ncbi:MAG: FMN phosphatase YigB (HAD superfamily) [Glaciecola sp.]|jgi:FMN phosphatase YigB (HAD superfamily)